MPTNNKVTVTINWKYLKIRTVELWALKQESRIRNGRVVQTVEVLRVFVRTLLQYEYALDARALALATTHIMHQIGYS